MKFKNFILFSLIFLISVRGYSSVVSLKASVSSPKITEDETFSAELIISWEGEEYRDFESPVLSGTKNCSIISTTVENGRIQTNGKTVSFRKYIYGLKPESVGMAWFGTAAVRYKEQGKERILVSPDLTVEVLPAVKKQVKFNFLYVLVPLILFVVCGGIIFIVYYYRKKFLVKKKEEEDPDKTSLHIRWEKFVSLKKNEDNLSLQQRYEECLNILKEHLKEKTGLKVVSSDYSLVERLSFDDSTKKEILDVFEQAVSVRYAGKTVSEKEFISLLNLTEKILMDNYMEVKNGQRDQNHK